MIPNIDTKMITLLGMPLEQSYAAYMQNLAYEAAGMNLIYFYTETEQEHLGDIVNGIRYMNFAGFAVTKPNKVEVLKYLDELDPLCHKMGACNTVVKTEEGKLIGYNTDGMGFYRTLRERNIEIEGKTFFCIGSGGVGRAICSVLAYFGAGKIYVTDIVLEAARELAEDINKNFAPIAQMVEYGDFTQAAKAAMVINASGVGMGEQVGESPMPKDKFDKKQIYFDACYNPAKTQFLLNAEAVGAEIMNGLDMSVYQGAEQIELWTGKKAPVSKMRESLERLMSIERKA